MSSGAETDGAGWSFTPGGVPGFAGPLTAFLSARDPAPRLLGLGEPVHGTEAFAQLRNDAFRQLVERHGYASVALETDCLAALEVDRYVTGVGARQDRTPQPDGVTQLGDVRELKQVLQSGLSHGDADHDSNRELIEWIRETNRGRDEADQIRCYGFDAPMEMDGAPSPRAALTDLYGYLSAHLDCTVLPLSAHVIAELAGEDDRWTDPAAAMDPARSVGGSADAQTLRRVTDDLLSILLAQSPQLIGLTSPDAWWQAQLAGRTAANLLRYHAAMAEPSAYRVARLMGLRDAIMAENLLAIAHREAARGPTLVFAHNRHLARELSTWQLGEVVQSWWSAGAIISAQFGERYAFVAAALGRAPDLGLGDPAPDTVEGVLNALPGEGCLFSSAELVGWLAGAAPALTVRTDSADDLGYFPLEAVHLTDSDGVVFLAHVR